MSAKIPEALPSKVETELLVPLAWRPILTQIASCLAVGDYSLNSRPDNVGPVRPDIAEVIAYQIAEYGDDLTALRDESWERAIYIWMGDHWEILVDLCTQEQGVSDLALFVSVYEDKDTFRFTVDSVHVP